MLVDAQGRPLRRKKQMATLVIYRSETGEAPWTPVMSAEVPEEIKEPEVIGRMVDGDMCRVEGDQYWYIAAKVSPPADGVH